MCRKYLILDLNKVSVMRVRSMQKSEVCFRYRISLSLGFPLQEQTQLSIFAELMLGNECDFQRKTRTTFFLHDTEKQGLFILFKV
jgi:hypothetical protein